MLSISFYPCTTSLVHVATIFYVTHSGSILCGLLTFTISPRCPFSYSGHVNLSKLQICYILPCLKLFWPFLLSSSMKLRFLIKFSSPSMCPSVSSPGCYLPAKHYPTAELPSPPSRSFLSLSLFWYGFFYQWIFNTCQGIWHGRNCVCVCVYSHICVWMVE